MKFLEKISKKDNSYESESVREGRPLSASALTVLESYFFQVFDRTPRERSVERGAFVDRLLFRFFDYFSL